VPGELSAPTEQGECLAQPLGDLGRFEMRRACGRELQGKRNAVETTADLHNGRGVARVEAEVRPDIMSTVEEESYGGEAPEPVEVAGVLRLRKFE